MVSDSPRSQPRNRTATGTRNGAHGQLDSANAKGYFEEVYIVQSAVQKKCKKIKPAIRDEEFGSAWKGGYFLTHGALSIGRSDLEV